MTFRIVADAPAEGVAFIEEQSGFGIDECGAGNARSDLSGGAVQPAKTAGECAAQNAFLNPGFVLVEFIIRGEAGEFGAGASAAGGAIISFAGALDEIAGVRAGHGGRSEKFNVIDFREALAIDGLANAPAKFGQLFSIGE